MRDFPSRFEEMVQNDKHQNYHHVFSYVLHYLSRENLFLIKTLVLYIVKLFILITCLYEFIMNPVGRYSGLQGRYSGILVTGRCEGGQIFRPKKVERIKQ